MGNLRSAQKALARQGADAQLTADPGVIADAVAVVLPGVGAFGACLAALRARGLEQPVLDAATSGRPFLGICVGCQMLFDSSEEDPAARGLGVIPGAVRWIPEGVKRPQMQWNRLDTIGAEPVLAGLGDRPWFYFVHSLHGEPADPAVVVGTCDYGGPLNAAFRSDDVFAVQFHPEKSATAGLGLLANFVAGLAVRA
ncbi:MAG: imidazole glycerol phosphate synthase subunit HisH [Acidimicrobiia bacterium]|nr:imidazole glycerol phosphate synthase subunit HisH [Acidimicrobiia bacterium]